MFGLLLIWEAGISQNADVVKFNAFQFAMIDRDDQYDKVKWSKTDILVVINAQKKKVSIYSDSEQEYSWISVEKSFDRDKDADVISGDAIDRRGKRCTIEFMRYRVPETEHIATLIITYRDFMWAYRLKEG